MRKGGDPPTRRDRQRGSAALCPGSPDFPASRTLPTPREGSLPRAGPSHAHRQCSPTSATRPGVHSSGLRLCPDHNPEPLAPGSPETVRALLTEGWSNLISLPNLTPRAMRACRLRRSCATTALHCRFGRTCPGVGVQPDDRVAANRPRSAAAPGKCGRRGNGGLLDSTGPSYGNSVTIQERFWFGKNRETRAFSGKADE
jgi:hypothetical protein